MIPLAVNTSSELINILSKIDIAVPMRSNGRTKEHMERYAMAHLVSTLMEAGLITYPVELIHRDRPDFMLLMGNRRIGIEHTEAISQNEAHKVVLRQRGHGTKMHHVSHILPGEPKKQHRKLIEEIVTNDPGDGWVGNSPETEWADAMLYFVKEKRIAVNKNGFERFDEDWLLIYDNWNLPAPDVREGASFFLKAVQQISAFKDFKRIFVMTEPVFCEISRNGFSIYEICDLWSSGHRIRSK